MTSKKKKEFGFTFIEFLVCVAIVGIVVTIAIPSLIRAREAEKMKSDPEYAQRVTIEKSEQVQFSVVLNIVYLYDSRVGLCYAYIPPSRKDIGPALAEVPCYKVKHLLPTVDQKARDTYPFAKSFDQ